MRLLALAIGLMAGVAVLADDAQVEQLLASFDREPTAAAANAFLKEIQARGLMEHPMQLSATAPADSLRQQVWYWAGEFFYDRQQYQQAVDYGRKALPLMAGRQAEADCLNLLGIACLRLGDYPNAARYAKLCYEKDEQGGDPDMMSSSLNTLAGIYMAASQPKEAEGYILKAIEMAEKADNPARMATLQGMASEVYHALGDNQQALAYIQRAYDMEVRLGREDKAVVRQTQMASVLIGLNDYEQAEQILGKAIPALRQGDNRHSLAIACNKMGLALLSQQRGSEAVPYYREAAELLMQMGDMYNEVHARRGLYESLWKSDPDAAKAELDRFNQLKDSIYTSTSAEMLAQYNAQFGNDWLQVENHRARAQLRMAIGVAVALALLAVALWWVMRRRMRRQLLQAPDPMQPETGAQPDGGHADGLSAPDRQFLARTISIINQQIDEGHVTVDSVASALCMSTSQFRRKLATVSGETPKNYIQTVRMQKAQQLLDTRPELSISEVAALCGYDENANFTRSFKRFCGVTPSDYQSRQR